MLERLTPALRERLVLIGGQALNFWAELYSSRAPELLESAPYTSKDSDFLGGPREVCLAARLLNGTPRLPTCDDSTPNTGTVVFEDDEGLSEQIDFLSDPPYGMQPGEVERLALPVDVGRGVVLRVMQPLHCMKSRAKNVYGLPAYSTPHALKQLRASVVCAREYFRSLLDEGETKATQRGFQSAYHFAARDAAGVGVFELHEVDPFAAVFSDPRLPGFSAHSYPRMLASLSAKRAKRRTDCRQKGGR